MEIGLFIGLLVALGFYERFLEGRLEKLEERLFSIMIAQERYEKELSLMQSRLNLLIADAKKRESEEIEQYRIAHELSYQNYEQDVDNQTV